MLLKSHRPSYGQVREAREDSTSSYFRSTLASTSGETSRNTLVRVAPGYVVSKTATVSSLPVAINSYFPSGAAPPDVALDVSTTDEHLEPYTLPPRRFSIVEGAEIQEADADGDIHTLDSLDSFIRDKVIQETALDTGVVGTDVSEAVPEEAEPEEVQEAVPDVAVFGSAAESMLPPTESMHGNYRTREYVACVL